MNHAYLTLTVLINAGAALGLAACGDDAASESSRDGSSAVVGGEHPDEEHAVPGSDATFAEPTMLDGSRPTPSSGGTPDAGSATGSDGFGDCPGGRLDQTTSLCWQDPPSPMKTDQASATAYCNDLMQGGSGDWRLPTQVELGSLVRGDESCELVCTRSVGPGPGGCYSPTALAGPCGNYFSSTTSVDPLQGVCVLTQNFDIAIEARFCGSVARLVANVRCVRAGT